jgi:tRNA dimethylallyltransferase
MGLAEEDISMKGIGYKEIIGYFDGLYTEDEVIDLIKKNSRHLAKRQLTWFRRYEDMSWFDLDEYQNDEDAIRSILLWLKEKYGYTTKVTDPTM